MAAPGAAFIPGLLNGLVSGATFAAAALGSVLRGPALDTIFRFPSTLCGFRKLGALNHLAILEALQRGSVVANSAAILTGVSEVGRANSAARRVEPWVTEVGPTLS